MKLHIGCGKRYLSGFTHVDVIPYEHVDIVADASDLSMVKSESVQEIYASHVLEHFQRDRVQKVLTEWRRVLVPKGILRLAVPDFEAIVDTYRTGTELSRLLGLLFGGQTYEHNFHHIIFDFAHIKEMLNCIGFSNIQRYDWRDFLPEGYDDYSRAYLPHLDFENGRLMSLNIIAEKD